VSARGEDGAEPIAAGLGALTAGGGDDEADRAFTVGERGRA
jgi:hypothetical protein